MDILMFPPELLTKQHVAYMLSTSEQKVMVLVHTNKLTVVRDGGKRMKFRLTDVRAYIDSLPDREPHAIVERRISPFGRESL